MIANGKKERLLFNRWTECKMSILFFDISIVFLTNSNFCRYCNHQRREDYYLNSWKQCNHHDWMFLLICVSLTKFLQFILCECYAWCDNNCNGISQCLWALRQLPNLIYTTSFNIIAHYFYCQEIVYRIRDISYCK